MKINLVKTSDGFKYAEDADAEKARSIKTGATVTADIRLFRNIKLHRKFFKLIEVAWNFLTEQQQAFFHGNMDSFRYSLEIAAGCVEMTYSPLRGEWVERAKSISFDKMDEAEFSKLYDSMVDVIIQLLSDKVDRDELFRALEHF